MGSETTRPSDDGAERFTVEMGDVHKPHKGPTGVKQILPAQMSEPWHAPEELAQAVRARHGQHEGDRPGDEEVLEGCRACFAAFSALHEAYGHDALTVRDLRRR